MGNVYGYVRVSTKEQNTDRQHIAMQESGVPSENIFEDKQSGKDFERPEYKHLLDTVVSGDVIYVKSIDRLGRSYKDILEQWKLVTKDMGVDICIIDMPLLDTRNGRDLMGTVISDVVLALLSYVSENERKTILQRQAEGIAAAKARGVRFGRPSIKLPEDFQNVVEQWESGEVSVNEILEYCGMSESTFYRRLREVRADQEKI
ncbi:MAG: recombinase family protein [Lachnospiraceae bacterium]|nr:recombinase family protein [Lachnospiraceae bacterium]